MFTAVSSDIFREVPDRVQIDTTQKRQKTTENQNAMGRQPSLSRTDVIYNIKTAGFPEGSQGRCVFPIAAHKRGGRGWPVFVFCSHGLGGEKGRSVAAARRPGCE